MAKNAEPESDYEESQKTPQRRNVLLMRKGDCILKKCQCHKRQRRKTVEMLQIEGDQRDMTTKCNT